MYQLRQPAPELRPYIENYWFVSAADGVAVDVHVDVFVDARADLIFTFGVPYAREVIGGARTVHAHSNLDAQRLVPIRIVQRGDVRLCGVRFKLGGLSPFARAPLRAFTNQTVPVAAVLGDGANLLESALASTTDVDAQARLLDAFFGRALTNSPAVALFGTVLERLVAAEGGIGVTELATAAQVSSRQVDRLFAQYLGIPPKTVGQVLRFQSTLRALMRDPGCVLADVAHAAGYFDQAHFIKDFKRMSGGVPRGYRGYFPPAGPHDFAPNVVVFLQDEDGGDG